MCKSVSPASISILNVLGVLFLASHDLADASNWHNSGLIVPKLVEKQKCYRFDAFEADPVMNQFRLDRGEPV